jgi:hypothetical protein
MNPRAIFSIIVCLTAIFAIPVTALGDDGYWFLDFVDNPTVPAMPLRVGIDAGTGFEFSTLTDDDGDGVISLPRIAAGSRLALDINHSNGEEGCDIWDLFGSGVQTGTSIQKPLLIVAEDVMGEALGIDYGQFGIPSPQLNPGDRFTVVEGRLAEWPDIRLVDNSNTPDLETFVQVVDSLPNFSGDVVVSQSVLRGTFVVPEPAMAELLLATVLSLVALTRQRANLIGGS